jgi:hypothetical protein
MCSEQGKAVGHSAGAMTTPAVRREPVGKELGWHCTHAFCSFSSSPWPRAFYGLWWMQGRGEMRKRMPLMSWSWVVGIL